MGHYVYKYVLNDEIIYIGKNDTDLHSRIRSHGRAGDNIPREAWKDINAAQVYYIELANSTMSDVVESELIRRYQPKYNKAKKSSDWAGLQFIEPDWIEYNSENKKLSKSTNNKDYKERYIKKVLDAVNHNNEVGKSLEAILDAIIFGSYEIDKIEDPIKGIEETFIRITPLSPVGIEHFKNYSRAKGWTRKTGQYIDKFTSLKVVSRNSGGEILTGYLDDVMDDIQRLLGTIADTKHYYEKIVGDFTDNPFSSLAWVKLKFETVRDRTYRGKRYGG